MGLGAIAGAVADGFHALRANASERQGSTNLVQNALAAQDFAAPGSEKSAQTTGRPSAALLPPNSEPVGFADLPEGFDPDNFFSDD